MNVFIITQDEPVYAPLYLEKIIDKLAPEHRVVGVTALSPSSSIGWLGLAKRKLDVYGPFDFVRAAALFASHRVKDLLPRRGRFHSVEKVLAHYGIEPIGTERVNAKPYLKRLEALDIDLLLSVAANQRFKRSILALPTRACLNVHSSLLPKYRGLDGLFWAVAHNESEVGVSVHTMNEAFDDGAIVAQQAFPVAGRSLHALYLAAIEVGSGLIAQAVDDFARDDVVLQANRSEEQSYYSWPDRQAARQFRANGGTFF